MIDAESPIERWRNLISGAGIAVISAAFVAGLALWIAGRTDIATDLFLIGCMLLIGMPILSVLAMLGEELRRGDWPFACAAALVLVLLAVGVFTRLWR